MVGKERTCFLLYVVFSFLARLGATTDEEILLLNELDRLAETAPTSTTVERPDEKPESHFCEFREPFKARVEEIFNKTISKVFFVPCADLEESMSTKTRREAGDICEVSRLVRVPVKRFVTKTVYRVVKRCCQGWTGDECTTAVEDKEVYNSKRSGTFKAGRCPAYSSPGRFAWAKCRDQCSSDDACPGTQKCCRVSCGGKKCVSPQLAGRTCRCQNGGTCGADRKCNCPPGFTGDACEYRLRFNDRSCMKQQIVVEYGTVPRDSLALKIAGARKIMEGLLQLANNDLNKACARKTFIRLGTVNITTVSSTYQITGTFEYLPYPKYSNWDFITCAQRAGILDGVVKDIKLAPAIRGDYSNYSATAVKKLPSQDPVVRTCCPVGSTQSAGSCVRCRVGSFHDRNQDKCVQCEGNTYQPNAARDSCIPCPDGQSPNKGKTLCQKSCIPECKNGGVCRAGSCYCAQGYDGKSCENPICSPSCEHGNCTKPGECDCDTGWGGRFCHKAICTKSCLNGGTCIAPDKCSCKSGYTGEQCGADYCRYPCENGGTCKGGSCICSNGWSGPVCEKAICSGGCGQGTCVQPEKCDCPPGLGGENCEISIIMTTTLPTFAASSLYHETNLCFTFGQSHFKTFDGNYFYFPGRCTYELVRDCENELFNILIANDPSCAHLTDCSRALEVYFGSIVIKIRRNSVTFDGKNVTLPHIQSRIVIQNVSGYILVYGYNNVKVKWDGHGGVYVQLAPEHRNSTCGLCGNFNGIKEDDFRDVDGKLKTTLASFGNSWARPGLNKMCRNVKEEETKFPCSKLSEPEMNKVRGICETINNYPFKLCHPYINPREFIKMCQEDLCSCNYTRDASCVCDSLTQYERACARQGVPIIWRKKDLCPVQCDNGKVYQPCGSACPKTCVNHYKVKFSCQEQCIDGCHCPKGTVLQNGGCYKVEECPCEHNKKWYKALTKIPSDCNDCYCTEGRWKCTKRLCPATCSATGDPHYRSFDGKYFSFMGQCQYILAQDAVANSFMVIVDNYACGTDNTLACTKTVTAVFNKTTRVHFKRGGMVTINGQDVVILPYKERGLTIDKASSLLTRLRSNIGVEIKWDGLSRVYVTVESHFRGKTSGLCGNFNKDQNDDFKTIENNIETSVVLFGNSWKYNPDCKNVKDVPHPCDVHIQRASEAGKKCSILKQAPFTKCHHIIDPEEGYFQSCKYDVCGCQDGTQCLCSAIAAYAHDCARHGVEVGWRNPSVLPECSIHCGISGQSFRECGSSCYRTCRDLANNKDCSEECAAGCHCPNGTLLDEDDVCIPISKCLCYHDGKSYQPNSVIKPNRCSSCTCVNGVFQCKNSTCTDAVCPKGQAWVVCGKQCAKTCDNLHLPCLKTTCEEGCICPEGLVFHNGQCVKPQDCPCHRGGRSYKAGETYVQECNTCTCTGTNWSCTTKECPGTCSVYGDSHYNTFDNKRYQFHGACDYVLVQDDCDGQHGSFRIQAENVPCGSTGVTCTKSITVTLNDTVIHLIRGSKPKIGQLPGSVKTTTTTDYRLEKSGLFLILRTNIKLTIVWDFGTRIYITLDPKFKGKTCGLCGNYNGVQSDDLKTPQGLVEGLSTDFGDSWKVESFCPDSKIPKHPCKVHKERAAWSRKTCNIIKRDVFKPCHDAVDPSPYYDACYYDACGCDTGGDCECMCTAIAAYARECNRHGVHIKWRKQELCPVQCEGGKIYTSCGPACSHTCGNSCGVDSICPVSCTEGCHCPHGTVEHNGKCIEEKDCPCMVDGKEHNSGSLVIKNCQRCICSSGCLSCSGPTCVPTVTLPTPSTIAPPTPGSTSSVRPRTQPPASSAATGPPTVAPTVITPPGSSAITGPLTPSTTHLAASSTTTTAPTVPAKSSTKPGITPAVTPSPSSSVQPGATPAVTPRPSSSVQPGATPAVTPSPSSSVQPGATPAVTPSPSSSVQPGATPAVTPSPSSSVQPGATPAVTPSPSSSVQPGATPAVTPSPSSSVQPGATPAVTPSPSSSVQPGATPAVTTSPSSSVQPGATPAVTPSPSSSVQPGATPAVTPSPSSSVRPGATPAVTTSPSSSVQPGATPAVTTRPSSSVQPGATPAVTPSPSSSVQPGATPAVTPSPSSSVQPGATPAVTTSPSSSVRPGASTSVTITPATTPSTIQPGMKTPTVSVSATPSTIILTTPSTTVVTPTCPSSCSSVDFQCRTSCDCISTEWVCDGRIDCSDGSDEDMCSPTPSSPVTPSTFIRPTSSRPPTPTSTPTPTPTPVCPEGMVYNECVPNCLPSCQYRNACQRASSSQDSCKPGCQCIGNSVYNGSHCIRPVECPCLHNGSYYEPMQKWTTECDVCSCWRNNVTCTPLPCPTIGNCPPPIFKIVKDGCCEKCEEVYPTLPTTQPTCPSNEFRCPSGKCIPFEWLCDGEKDCQSGEDEINCRNVSAICNDTLGAEYGGLVPDSSFRSSSQHGWYYRPSQGRLYNQHMKKNGAGSWCAADSDAHPWFQVKLVKFSKVTKVAIQGQPLIYTHLVESYMLDYSNDSHNWITYKEDGVDHIFNGSTDNEKVSFGKIRYPFVARYVRILPIQWPGKRPCLRVNFYGCEYQFTITTPTPSITTPTPCEEFTCDNGRCAKIRHICDGYNDCGDNSDERNCTCKKYEFACKNGNCTNPLNVCDGEDDCGDGSDEPANCTRPPCPEFTCDDGKCISYRHLCDKESDCLGGEDERSANCTTPTPPPCEYWCPNSQVCIKKSWLCDMFSDCPNNTDEKNCPCPTGQWACPKSKKCIPTGWVCDNITDCPDAEDETSCPPPPTSSSSLAPTASMAPTPSTALRSSTSPSRSRKPSPSSPPPSKAPPLTTPSPSKARPPSTTPTSSKAPQTPPPSKAPPSKAPPLTTPSPSKARPPSTTPTSSKAPPTPPPSKAPPSKAPPLTTPSPSKARPPSTTPTPSKAPPTPPPSKAPPLTTPSPSKARPPSTTPTSSKAPPTPPPSKAPPLTTPSPSKARPSSTTPTSSKAPPTPPPSKAPPLTTPSPSKARSPSTAPAPSKAPPTPRPSKAPPLTTPSPSKARPPSTTPTPSKTPPTPRPSKAPLLTTPSPSKGRPPSTTPTPSKAPPTPPPSKAPPLTTPSPSKARPPSTTPTPSKAPPTPPPSKAPPFSTKPPLTQVPPSSTPTPLSKVRPSTTPHLSKAPPSSTTPPPSKAPLPSTTPHSSAAASSTTLTSSVVTPLARPSPSTTPVSSMKPPSSRTPSLPVRPPSSTTPTVISSPTTVRLTSIATSSYAVPTTPVIGPVGNVTGPTGPPGSGVRTTLPPGCVHNGTFYKYHSSFENGSCTTCMCYPGGFNCTASCNIKSCPKNQELINRPDECCFCQPKCRKGMVYKNCSCQKSCEDSKCSVDTCVPGCQCPDGTFDNGTSCVPRDQCYCMVNGTIVQPGEKWREGECLSCKCIDGQKKCGHKCDIMSCPEGKELQSRPGECCKCVPVAPTCKDINGKIRQLNETWNEDKCTKCVCESDRNIACFTTGCSTCSVGTTPVYEKDKCCPKCVTTTPTPPLGCTVNGTTHKPGKTWEENNCTKCSCSLNGTVMCDTKVCPECPAKTSPTPSPGKCCPTCASLPDVCVSNGVSYEIEQEWKPSPCKTCRCGADLNIVCEVTSCVECPEGYQKVNISEQCCPNCVPIPTTPTPTPTPVCNYNGTRYKIGETWNETVCQTCTCQSDLVVSCKLKTCADCSSGYNAVSVPGQCCRKCVPKSTSRPTTEYPRSSTKVSVIPTPSSAFSTRPSTVVPTAPTTPLPTTPIINCTMNGKIYTVGAKWNVSNCETCECNGNFSISCRMQQCPVCPSGQREVPVPSQCCAKCVTIIPSPTTSVPTQLTSTPTPPPDYCTVNGTRYKIGESWMKTLCEQCKCQNNLVISCTVKKCSPCTTGYKPVSVPGKCCWKCVRTASPTPGTPTPTSPPFCTMNGMNYTVGEKWKVSNCETCECEKDSNINCHKQQCSDCPSGQRRAPPSEQCCGTCVSIIPSATTIPPTPVTSTPTPLPNYCTVNGTRYKVGESWNKTLCEKCTCESNLLFTCIIKACPQCSSGYQAVSVDGECCWDCVPKSTSRPTPGYTMSSIEVSGQPTPSSPFSARPSTVVPTTPTTPLPTTPTIPTKNCTMNGKNYTVGETWKVTNCETCTCNEDFSTRCRIQTCVDCPSAERMVPVSGQCCGKCVPIIPSSTTGPPTPVTPTPTAPPPPCTVNGTRYKVGESWNKTLCEKCTCESNLLFTCIIKACPQCSSGYQAASVDGECCWECVPKSTSSPTPGYTRNSIEVSGQPTPSSLFSTRPSTVVPTTPTTPLPTTPTIPTKYCRMNGKNYTVGQKWNESVCEVCTCEEDFSVLCETQTCSECVPGYHNVSVPGQCCDKCEPIITTPSPTPITKPPLHVCSVESKFVNVTDKKGCIGQFQSTRCSGSCESESDIDFFTYPFIGRNCSCCQPQIISKAVARLTCSGSSYTHPYIVIRECRCTACGTNPVRQQETALSRNIESRLASKV